MTAVQYRPTLLNSCARAATAAEARFRINYPIATRRASRVVALDQDAAAIVRRVAELPWSGAHFLTYEAPTTVDGLDGVAIDATLRASDGSQALLSDELAGADVAVMVATNDDCAEAAAIIGQACGEHGIMTAGLVVDAGGAIDRAVSALRAHAMVLVVTADEDDVPEMLTALRA